MTDGRAGDRMIYENMPLYPGMRPPTASGECVRMPLFRPGCGSGRECERVVIENPCCPGECAEVALGVDACGNLTVCVRRGPGRRHERRCLPPPCGHPCGTWDR